MHWEWSLACLIRCAVYRTPLLDGLTIGPTISSVARLSQTVPDPLSRTPKNIPVVSCGTSSTTSYLFQSGVPLIGLSPILSRSSSIHYCGGGPQRAARDLTPQRGAGAAVQRIHAVVPRADINHRIRHGGHKLHDKSASVAPQQGAGVGGKTTLSS